MESSVIGLRVVYNEDDYKTSLARGLVVAILAGKEEKLMADGMVLGRTRNDWPVLASQPLWWFTRPSQLRVNLLCSI